MSDYTQAPATQILATHCCACGLPLLDAESVESGIGPVCRKKYLGKRQGASDEARVEANRIVHHLALAISGGARGEAGTARAIGPALAARGEAGAAHLQRLRDLGFLQLADKLEKAWVVVHVEETAGELRVKAPFSEETLAAARAIPGRSWDSVTKRNTYPVSQRAAVWRLLCRYYPGVAGVGPQGLFVVPAPCHDLARTVHAIPEPGAEFGVSGDLGGPASRPAAPTLALARP